jgi:hypothetical protein
MPAPINLEQMYSAATKAAREQMLDQEASILRLYPQVNALQLDTISQIANNLNNEYTSSSNEAISQASNGINRLNISGDRIGSTAANAEGLATSAQQFAQGPTALDQQISALGASAMSQQADQVQSAKLGQISNIQGPSGYSPAEIRAQQISAAQAGSGANVQGATTGPIERVAGTRVAAVGPASSARVRRVQDVRSRDIQASAAENALMQEAVGGGLAGQLRAQAQNDMALGRSLSSEQSRDAIQSARSGAAARGMATGNSALAAELLNRDRYATQRQNDRRAFASGVLNQSTGIQQAANQAYAQRQDANAGRALQADSTNQSVAQARAMQNAQFAQQANLADNQNAQQRVLAEAGYAQQAGLSNQDFGFRAASQDAQLAQQAALANQQSGLQLGFTNAQLQQAAALANQQAALEASRTNQAAANRAYEFQQQGNLQASLANQSTQSQMALADAQFAQQASLANQDANQRQVEMNRAFLQNANQSGINSEISRGGYAMGALGQTANLYGQQAGAYQNAAALALNTANQYMAVDPYMRAFAPGTTMGGNNFGTGAQMIGQTFGNAVQSAGNVASFNANMAMSDRISARNYNAAIQGAAMQAAAAGQAGMMGMVGSLGGAAIGAVGLAAF